MPGFLSNNPDYAQAAHVDDEDPQKAAFLDALSAVESNHGLRTHHRTMQSGIHKGSSAYGNYGLMPLTVKDAIKHDKDYSYLTELDDKSLKEELHNNPEIEKRVLDTLYSRLDKNMLGDPYKMAYAWNQGTSLRSGDVDKRGDLEDKDYVKKFEKAYTPPLKDGVASVTPAIRGNTPKLVSMLAGDKNSQVQSPQIPQKDNANALAQFQALANQSDDDEESSTPNFKPYIDQLANSKAEQSLSTPIPSVYEDENKQQSSSVVPLTFEDHQNNLRRIKQLIGGYGQ